MGVDEIRHLAATLYSSRSAVGHADRYAIGGGVLA